MGFEIMISPASHRAPGGFNLLVVLPRETRARGFVRHSDVFPRLHRFARYPVRQQSIGRSSVVTPSIRPVWTKRLALDLSPPSAQSLEPGVLGVSGPRGLEAPGTT